MKKTLSLILVIASLFCMVAVSSGCGVKADYEAPLEMVHAYRNGTDVTGKTVSFYATDDYHEDYKKGYLFDSVTPDFSASVTIIATNEAAKKVKKGDTVVVKIDRVEERLATYEFYGKVVS